MKNNKKQDKGIPPFGDIINANYLGERTHITMGIDPVLRNGDASTMQGIFGLIEDKGISVKNSLGSSHIIDLYAARAEELKSLLNLMKLDIPDIALSNGKSLNRIKGKWEIRDEPVKKSNPIKIKFNGED